MNLSDTMVVKFNNAKDENEHPKNSTKVNVLIALILVLFIALVSVSLLLGLEVRFCGQTESEFLFQYLHFQRKHGRVQNILLLASLAVQILIGCFDVLFYKTTKPLV